MDSSWTIVEPDGATRTLAFSQDTITLGRSTKNDLCFQNDTSLSRQHLTLTFQDQVWQLQDLNSMNGTQVNGIEVLGCRPVHPGDRITAGRITLVLQKGDEQNIQPVTFYPHSEAGDLGPEAILTNLEGVLSTDADPVEKQGMFGSTAVDVLIRAGRELCVHRPLEDLFHIILQLSIRATGADRGVIMTFENEELVPRAHHGEGFAISALVRDRAIRERSSILIRDVAQDEALSQRQTVADGNVHGIMVAPLQTERDVLGLIYVDNAGGGRGFRADDLNLFTVLANVAAFRVEQERLAAVERREQALEWDLRQAAEIQAGLLPSVAPEMEGLDLAGFNAPCRMVGGDYFDFLPYGDRKMELVLGDVAGKGMSAALLMTGLQARVRMLAEGRGELSQVMSQLDRSVASGCPGCRFISLVLCVFDARNGDLQYCNAGHNPPILVRTSGDVELLPGGGTVLGFLPEVGYQAGRTRLDSGDLVVLYSDGVTEALNAADAEFGENRLVDLIRSLRDSTATALIGGVTDALEEWTAGMPPYDDLTLVVARRT
jgi:serine phosphatase RsbU (regulator of sigma subunit)